MFPASLSPCAGDGRKTTLTAVSRAQPCAVCRGDHKCSRGADGLIVCGRSAGAVPGFRFLGPCQGDPQFSLYRLEEPCARPAAAAAAPSWPKLAQAFAAGLTGAGRASLAQALGLPPRVWEPPAPLPGLPAAAPFPLPPWRRPP